MESSKVYSNCWKILAIVAVFMIGQGTAEVQRLYSLGNPTNRSHACATNEEILLICHGSGSNITWTATSDSIDIGRIVFFNSDSEGMIINQGIIRGFLIDVDANNNLVSELRVYTAPSMRPVSMTCSSQSGRSSHLIAPSAVPDTPVLKEPRQLLQVDSNTTYISYYLQWAAPLNIDNVDLDHYRLYANDTLMQRIHADQRYALIDLQEGVSTTIKLAAANRCGQISNYSSVTITPTTLNPPHGPQTTSDNYTNTLPDFQANTNANIDDYMSGSQKSRTGLIILASTTFLALLTQGSLM